jgi:2-phosphoglycerate kinase
MVLACTPKSQINKKFPYEKLQLEKDATPYQDMIYNSPRILLRAEITESKTLWLSTRRMIEHLIDCQQDYIIDGVHLMPVLVNQLKGTRYWKQIRSVYLVKTDLDEIKDGFSRNGSRHDWLSSALKDKDLVDKTARMVQTKSVYIADQAEKNGFTVVDTGKDFEQKLNALSRKF